MELAIGVIVILAILHILAIVRIAQHLRNKEEEPISEHYLTDGMFVQELS